MLAIASSALVALVRCPGFKLENDDERKVLDSFLAIAKTVQSKLGSTTTSTDIQDVAALRAIGRFIEKVVLEQCELRLTEMQWESIMLLAETMLNVRTLANNEIDNHKLNCFGFADAELSVSYSLRWYHSVDYSRHV